MNNDKNKKILIVKKKNCIICNKNLFEMEGISNKTIANFFTEKTNYIKKKLLVFFLLKM